MLPAPPAAHLEEATKKPRRARGKVKLEPWSSQFLHPPHKRLADLVIGLDFGTSCSKVVVRSPFMHQSRAVAVPFGKLGHRSSEYLLPTRIYHNTDDTVTLTPGEVLETLTDMKVLMMQHRTDLQIIAFGAAYLAHVVRQTRQWFLKEERDAYGTFGLRWSMNLGIPSAGYDDGSTRDAFGRAARVAWRLAGEPGEIRWSHAVELAEQDADARLDDGIEINVVPEVAAEVVGYARSTLRDPGLHIMLDVGASTLDICSFNLRDRDGEDQYALVTALVEPLGVFNLHMRRMDEMGEEPPSRVLSTLDLSDPLSVIPERGEDYVSAASVVVARLRAADREHIDACRSNLMQTIVDLKKRRDPHSDRWQSGLPVFVCGGGSRMRCFKRVVTEAHRRMTKLHIGNGLVTRPLPKPASLKTAGLHDEMFDRLAVAYGLSFDSLDIGKIVPPSAIEDVPTAPASDWRSRFVSKDHV